MKCGSSFEDEVSVARIPLVLLEVEAIADVREQVLGEGVLVDGSGLAQGLGHHGL